MFARINVIAAPASSAPSGPSFFQRLAAGGTAGALAIAVFNPAEASRRKGSGAPDMQVPPLRVSSFAEPVR